MGTESVTTARRERLTESRPPARRFGVKQWLDEVIAYSELLSNLVARDLKTKYRGSFLGMFWSLLNPLLLMVVYTLVFSVIVRVNIHPYAVFLLSGLVPWNAFAMSLTSATNSVFDNRDIVRKVFFPHQVLPLSAVLANSVNFAINILLLLVLTVVFHVSFTFTMLLLPVLVAQRRLAVAHAQRGIQIGSDKATNSSFLPGCGQRYLLPFACQEGLDL